nr:glycosyltransferase family 61 protein [Spirochaetota bacterium]
MPFQEKVRNKIGGIKYRFDLFIKKLIYKLIYKPYGIIGETEFNRKNEKLIKIIPSETIDFILPGSLEKRLSSYFKYEKKSVKPDLYIYCGKNARIETDNPNNISVIKNRRLISPVSFQYGKDEFIEAKFNSAFSKKYCEKPKYFDKTIFSTIIGGAGTANYYHWLFDALPKIDLLKKSGYYDSTELFYVPNYQYNFQKETLTLLGITEDKVITAIDYPHIKAKKILAASHLNPNLPQSERICDFLKDSFIKCASDKKFNDKIYISRSKTRRKITNEDEIFYYLENKGFIKIFLEELTFREQVALFHNAEHIVSPHGAGLTNLVFSKKNTKILEIFSPQYVVPYYYCISKTCGLDYDFIVGEDREKSASDYLGGQTEDIYVDIKALR